MGLQFDVTPFRRLSIKSFLALEVAFFFFTPPDSYFYDAFYFQSSGFKEKSNKMLCILGIFIIIMQLYVIFMVIFHIFHVFSAYLCVFMPEMHMLCPYYAHIMPSHAHFTHISCDYHVMRCVMRRILFLYSMSCIARLHFAGISRDEN